MIIKLNRPLVLLSGLRWDQSEVQLSECFLLSFMSIHCSDVGLLVPSELQAILVVNVYFERVDVSLLLSSSYDPSGELGCFMSHMALTLNLILLDQVI